MKEEFCFTVLFAALAVGCAQVPLEDIRHRNLSNLGRLQIGMSQEEVREVMGDGSETVVENVYHECYLSGYRRLEVSNPYKREFREVNDRTYELLYYYASNFGMRMGFWDRSYIERRVPDYVLTPVVFEDERLIGWGNEFAEEKDLAPEEAPEEIDPILYGR